MASCKSKLAILNDTFSKAQSSTERFDMYDRIFTEIQHNANESVDIDDLTTAITNINIIEVEQRHYTHSLPLLKHLLSIQQLKYEVNDVRIIKTLSSLGNVLLAHQELQQAHHYIQWANLIADDDEKVTKPSLVKAIVLGDLARVYGAMNLFDKQIKMFTQALEMKNSYYEEKYNQIRLKHRDASKIIPTSYSPEFWEEWKATTRENARECGITRCNLGIAFIKTNQIEKAIDVLQIAHTNLESGYDSNHYLTLLAYKNLHLVYVEHASKLLASFPIHENKFDYSTVYDANWQV